MSQATGPSAWFATCSRCLFRRDTLHASVGQTSIALNNTSLSCGHCVERVVH